jgi:hypothetical protein
VNVKTAPKVAAQGFEASVLQQLSDSGLTFVTEPRLMGLQPDFVIAAPDGQQIVVEVKGNGTLAKDHDAVVEQVQFYVDQLGATLGVVVVPDSELGSGNQFAASGRVKVVGLAGFWEELRHLSLLPPPQATLTASHEEGDIEA